MVKKGEQTEKKILEAAHNIFHEKGYHGARMQEIADKAEINKGLLHYYFKSKDKLFEKIFGIAFNQMFSTLSRLMNAEVPTEQKLKSFADKYLELLSKNSFLPVFVLNELNRNPDKFLARVFARKGRPNIQPFITQVKQEIIEGKIRPIDPAHLLLNVLSLCVFPFIGRPMFQSVLDLSRDEYKHLMKERKIEVFRMIELMLRP